MKNNGQGNDAKVAVNLGTINQTNITGGDATKENQDEILKLLHSLSNGKEEEWLQKYFGDDWKIALQNHQTYTNLKKKLMDSSNNLEKLMKEKEEVLAKFSDYHLNKTMLHDINNAIQELRYDDAEKLLVKYLNSSDTVARDRVRAHYQKALVHLEKIEYYQAKDEIENIPSKKVEDPNLLNDYARIYEFCGEFKEALPLFEKSLNIHQKVEGEEHPNTATSYDNLAGIYESMGEYGKALPLYKKALKIRQNKQGEENIYTSTSYNNIAGLYKLTREYNKALSMFEKALKIHQNILGAEHPRTAVSYNNLAGLYKLIGEYTKALPLYEKALKIHQKVLGTEHPNTATVYNDIAGLYQLIGEYDKALPLHEKALNIYQNIFGLEHPDTATSYNNIAVFYYEQKNFKKAYEYMKKSVDIGKKVLPDNHPDLIASLKAIEVIKSRL